MEKDLRFGVAKAVFGKVTEEHLAAVCAALASWLGRPVTSFVARSYDELLRAFEAREVEAAWLAPMPALRGIARGVLLPIAVPVRRGRSSFYAVLFSKKGSPFDSGRRLVGARAAWVDAESAAGYLVMRARLGNDGMPPASTFVSETFYGSHDEVVRAVLGGKADVGSTYQSAALPGEEENAGWTDVPGAEQIQVLAKEGPIPHDVIAIATHLSPVFAEEAQAVLLDETSPVAVATRALLQADKLVAPVQQHLAPLARILAGW
jgi:phosphonate transport system substrate-binding protein